MYEPVSQITCINLKKTFFLFKEYGAEDMFPRIFDIFQLDHITFISEPLITLIYYSFNI